MIAKLYYPKAIERVYSNKVVLIVAVPLVFFIFCIFFSVKTSKETVQTEILIRELDQVLNKSEHKIVGATK